MTEPSHAGRRGYLPARIALLALRGTLRRGKLREPIRYRLNSSPAVVDVEAAATALADAPKPLDLAATARAGILEVTFHTLATAEELAAHEWIRGGLDDRGGPLGFLRERYGTEFDHLPALCVGANERLRVTVSDFLTFHQEYRASPRTGWGAAFADSVYAQRECGVRLEEAQNLCAVVGFHPSRGNFGIAFPLPAWIARLFDKQEAS